MFDFLKKRPMLLCSALASVVSVIGFFAETALFIICPFILAILFIMYYKKVRLDLIFSVFMVLLIAVSCIFSVNKADKIDAFSGKICQGEFVVTEEPENRGTYYTVTLEAVDCDLLKRGTRVTANYNKGEMKAADYINAEITLKSLSKLKSKYTHYSENVFIKGSVKTFERTGEKDSVIYAVSRVRQYIKTEILKYYGFSQASTMMALITGDKSYFTNGFYQNVKSAGVAHVMVVSGMHLSIIVALVLYLTNKLFYNRFFKAFLIILATFSVMTVCGFTMSIMRAGITYLFVALALLIRRETTPANTLGSAVSLILLFNPYAIKNVGFILSVLSTFSILAVAIPIIEYINQNKIIKNRLLLSVVASILISLSALIFTAPVTIYVFGYISNVSWFTNLLVSLAVTVAMNLCILGFILPFGRSLLFFLGDLVVRYINWVISYFGSLPFATTRTHESVAFLVAILITLILWVLVACKKRQDVIKLKSMRFKKYNEREKVKWR